jgi:8-oxo-dGTP diphosphatase
MRSKKPSPYVNGFLFDPTLTHVVLLRKNKPPHQEGLLNGVGGKIDAGETPLQAMEREFREEAWPACNKTPEWTEFAVLNWTGSHHPNGAQMHLFRATGNVWAARSLTAEKVEVFKVADLMDRCDTIFNLRWILQMARSFYFGKDFGSYKVEGILGKS